MYYANFRKGFGNQMAVQQSCDRMPLARVEALNLATDNYLNGLR